MVIEYIKRGQKMGYIGDTLVYKIPESEPSPVINEEIALESPPILAVEELVESKEEVQPVLQLEDPEED